MLREDVRFMLPKTIRKALTAAVGVSLSDRAGQSRGVGRHGRRLRRGGRRSWADAEPTWGDLAVPEPSVGTLPDVAGFDVIELGCGTAYVSAWLARRGARPVGIDIAPEQLATARALQVEHGLSSRSSWAMPRRCRSPTLVRPRDQRVRRLHVV